MPTFSKTQRLRIAIGGFVSFIGFLILIAALLTATGATNLETVFQNEFVVATIGIVGIADVFCGITLFLMDRQPFLLFASHKKETDDDVNQANKNPDHQT